MDKSMFNSINSVEEICKLIKLIEIGKILMLTYS